jgi:hypothetical protein
MARSIEDYARELIGAQAMQIISLRAQLDNALEKIKQLMNEGQGTARPTSDSTESELKE